MSENDADSRQYPYAFSDGQGRIFPVGVDFILKASELQRGSGVAVMEYTTKKGEEPGDHTHPTEDEMFYVLSGSISFHCGGKTFDLTAGGFVFLPRGIKHGYRIVSDDPVRLLVITAPVRESKTAGWGGFVGEMEAVPPS